LRILNPQEQKIFFFGFEIPNSESQGFKSARALIFKPGALRRAVNFSKKRDQ
jgi:hypothetical protein